MPLKMVLEMVMVIIPLKMVMVMVMVIMVMVVSGVSRLLCIGSFYRSRA